MNSASTQQRIRLLAAAFNVCQNPSTPHLHKLARRTHMTSVEVEEWFERRRVLEEWVQREGLDSAAEIAAALTRTGLLVQMSKVALADEPAACDDLLPIAATTVA